MTTKTGTGSVMFNDTPTLIAPILGTPTSGNATNLTNIPITLTTTGTSGAATYTQATSTLNIPQYSGGGSGTVTSVGFTGGLISIATPTSTPAFTVAGTSGGIPYFSSGAAWASSAALTAHGVVIGGGAGTAPTSTAAGTSGQVLTSNGASADPTFQTVTGTGTVTVVGAGSVTSTAITTGGGGTAIQTPSATTTLDTSGNVSTPGTISSGVGSGNAGAIDMGAGTSVTVPANSFGFGAPATMTTSVRLESPNSVPSANNVMLFGAPSSNKATWAWTGISGTGSFCMTTNCAMTTPNLGIPSALDLTNATKIPLTLTTTGSSGASTYTQSTNTLNIPQYTGGGTSGGTVVSKTVDYSAVSGDSGTVIYFNGTNKTYTLLSTVPTMPWIVGVCNINSTALTIARGTATINGGSSNISLPQYQCTTIESDTATGGNNYVANAPFAVTAPITLTEAANVQTFACPTCLVATVNPSAGLLRVAGSTQTATGAELSGDATTSGSNAVTVVKVNGNTPGNTCTNQFERSIDTSARGTCASIAQADLPATTRARGIPFTLGDPTNSAALTTSYTAYVTVPFACTISAYNLLVDATDTTLRVKFWKVATGTAIPTVSNSISTSGLGVPSATAVHSTTVSDFTTTTVTANDIMAMNVSVANTAKMVQGTLQCDQ